MYVFTAAILGAIAGSFLNAVSFRAGTGRSALSFSKAQGRSMCMHCGHTLGALELVPVFSYLALRGRCAHCGSKISMQYPLVELAAAALSAAAAWQSTEPAVFVLWFVASMAMLYAVVYDLRHKVIPWSCSGILAVLGLVHVWLAGAGLWGLIAGPAVAAPLLLLSLLSGGRWMGWGDGILMLGVGWLLGLSPGYTALMLGFWSGAAVGIALMWLRRGYTMDSELPFAPFLIAGAWAAYFLHVDLFATLPALFS